jgi:hypothetical protein
MENGLLIRVSEKQIPLGFLLLGPLTPGKSDFGVIGRWGPIFDCPQTMYKICNLKACSL